MKGKHIFFKKTDSFLCYFTLSGLLRTKASHPE